MKPYYSIDELCDLPGLDEDDPIAVVDALSASNVPMFFNGEPADLSDWYKRRPKKNAQGSIVIVSGEPEPPADKVIVASESLPISWKKLLEVASIKPENKPIAEVSKALDDRERTTLLCIIGAIAKQYSFDLNEPYKAGGQIEAMLIDDGIKVSSRTIGDHLKSVSRAMESRKR